MLVQKDQNQRRNDTNAVLFFPFRKDHSRQAQKTCPSNANHHTGAHMDGLLYTKVFPLCLVFKRGLLQILGSVSSGILLLVLLGFSRSFAVDTAVLLSGLLSIVSSTLIGLGRFILQFGNLFLGLGDVLYRN